MLELRDQEIVLITTQAYFYENIKEQVIGDLKVTNQRTYFEPKRLPLLQQQIKIEIFHEEIEHVEKFDSFHFIPNGLKIISTDNQEYKFKVFDRQRIINLYQQANVDTL